MRRVSGTTLRWQICAVFLRKRYLPTGKFFHLVIRFSSFSLYFPCRVSRVNNDNNDNNDDSVNDSDDDNDGESENYELTRAANHEKPLTKKLKATARETRILICCCCSTIASTAGRRFTRDQVASSTSRW